MLFIQAATKCIWRVASEASGALGIFFAVAGSVAEAWGRKVVMPNWGWIAIGAALLFITACKIEMELMRERESRRKPEPNMRLEDVVRRIRRKADIFGPDNVESMEVLRAFNRIAERAQTGAITVFGAQAIRYVPEHGDVDALLRRVPIPVSEWGTHSIDYTAFLSDRSGRLAPEDPRERNNMGQGYGYIWFDRAEIDAIWPPPRRKITLRSPLGHKDRA